MSARVLRTADYRRMRWKNGGGWTTELAVSPEPGADAFDWRISIAEIESDGAFSTFPLCDRWIALLEGNGNMDSLIRIVLYLEFAREGSGARKACGNRRVRDYSGETE